MRCLSKRVRVLIKERPNSSTIIDITERTPTKIHSGGWQISYKGIKMFAYKDSKEGWVAYERFRVWNPMLERNYMHNRLMWLEIENFHMKKILSRPKNLRQISFNFA